MAFCQSGFHGPGHWGVRARTMLRGTETTVVNHSRREIRIEEGRRCVLDLCSIDRVEEKEKRRRREEIIEQIPL